MDDKLELDSSSGNMVCITEIIDDPGCIVHGNFCKIYDSKIDLTYIDRSKKICLYYTKISSGSSKKVYIGLRDKKGKKFISTDEKTLLYKYRGLKSPKETLQKYYDEITYHQTVYKSYPKLVPKIYAANIYQDCSEQYRLQVLMEDVTDGGYVNLDSLPKDAKKFEIEENDEYVTIKNLIYEYFNLFSQQNVGTRVEETSTQIYAMYLALKNKIFNKEYLNDKLWIIIPVLYNIKKIHNLGIIHGDVKNDNVFVKLYGGYIKNIKFIDFGVSSRQDKLIQTLSEKCDMYKRLYTPEYGESNTSIIINDILKRKSPIELEFYNYQNESGDITSLFLNETLFHVKNNSIFLCPNFMFFGLENQTSKFGDGFMDYFDTPDKLNEKELIKCLDKNGENCVENYYKGKSSVKNGKNEKDRKIIKNKIIEPYIKYILPIRNHVIDYVKCIYDKL